MLLIPCCIKYNVSCQGHIYSQNVALYIICMIGLEGCIHTHSASLHRVSQGLQIDKEYREDIAKLGQALVSLGNLLREKVQMRCMLITCLFMQYNIIVIYNIINNEALELGDTPQGTNQARRPAHPYTTLLINFIIASGTLTTFSKEQPTYNHYIYIYIVISSQKQIHFS